MSQLHALASGQLDYSVMTSLALFSWLLLISSTAAESYFACDSSTVRPGNGLPYYEVLPSPATYNTAELKCKNKGADLPAFKDNTTIITDPPRIWLSARRRHWIHRKLGLAFTLEQMASDQLKAGDGNCIVVDSGQLISSPCSAQFDVICMTYSRVSCPGSKYFYDNRCYNKPSWLTTKTTFEAAVSTCDDVLGFLIEIYSKKQLQWIINAFPSLSFWSGYSYDSANEEYYWYDGSPLTDATWVNGSSGSGDCAVLNEYGELEHSDCNAEHPVVCALDVPYATEPNTTCVSENDECVCYWLISESKTFHEAMEYCLSDGGTMFYPNNDNRLQLLTSLGLTQDLWIGISAGHTRGVFRGSDASAITWAVWDTSEPDIEGGKDCGYLAEDKFYAADCYEKKIFACQSQPDPDLYPCSEQTGCLGADYWIVDDPVLVYTGQAEVVVRNMDTFERCWDTCINYIGFVCVVITYDKQLKECRLNSDTSGVWQVEPRLQSRNRTRNVVDPTSYCLTVLSELCQFDDAAEKCASYRNGWTISVIRDEVMQRRLADNDQVWISARSEMPGVYKTHAEEYIPYSDWSPDDPDLSDGKCVIIENQLWVSSKCDELLAPSCFAYLDDICRDYPSITNGKALKDRNTGGVLLTCHNGYYSANLNVTSHYVQCDCNWYENFEEFGNCTAIQCPSPEDSSNGTIFQDNGHGINDTVVYQSPQGKQVAQTGLIYFNRTCNLIANSTLGEWSEYPSFEDLNCGYDIELENASVIKYGISIGSVMEITCRSRYRIYNSTADKINSTCMLDDNGVIAKWCWVPPCQDILCPPPESNTSGTLVKIFGMKVNDTALYRCPYGYGVAGTSQVYYNRTCTQIENTITAEWSDFPTIEELSCNSNVPSITNANVTYFGLSVGSLRQVVCDEGYRIENSTTNTINSTCEIDKLGTRAEWCWVPPCTDIICPEPELVAMATHIQYGNKTNDTVTYTCQTNYRITGASTNKANATCGYDENFQGVWLQVPQCEAITCDEPPMLANASIQVSAPNRSDIGAMVTYQCNENFTLYYENVQLNTTNLFNATCRVDMSTYSGVWINDHTCDIPRCGNPPHVENSDFEMTNDTVHSLVNYTCHLSYLFGNTGTRWTTSECVNIPGQLLPEWTSVGNCTLVTCGEAPSIPHASLVSSSNNIGDVAKYSCDVNYKLANVSSVVTEFQITCSLQDTLLSANWSEPPICEEMLCSSPPEIDNGKVDVRGYRVGETAVYTCDAHYKMSGDGAGFGLSITQESVCVSDPVEGLFWENVPTCISEDAKVEEKPIIRQCAVPPSVKGASLQYKGTFLNSAVTYVTYSSHVFEFGGRSRSLVCQSNGQWSANVTSPKHKECPTLHVTGATLSTTKNTSGTEVTITCIDPKAKLDNGLSKVKVRCTNLGTWTYMPTSCEGK